MGKVKHKDTAILCWCGSERPYKECHLDREKQKPLEVYEATEHFQKEFSRRCCMHPQQSSTECSKQIVEAHSVSRSTNLRSIAENGHVMQFIPGTPSSIDQNGGVLSAQRIGVNKASVFTGFCHNHDNSTFKLIDQPIVALSDQHIFLLSFRAICREMLMKMAAMRFMKFVREMDREKDVSSQKMIQEINHFREQTLKLGLKDLNEAKAKYDEALLSEIFGGISWYLIELDHSLDIVCTVGFTPEVDFHGNRLQILNHPNTSADTMTCSIIKTANGSAIVLAWLSETNEACSRFVASLEKISNGLLPTAIIRMVFEYGENVFFSPSWWNNLDESAKNIIKTHANSFYDKPSDCLKHDDKKLALWSVTRRERR